MIHPAPKPKRKARAPRQRPKSVNRKRKASEFVRCYGSKERVAWVHRRRCLVRWCVIRPSENAHVVTGGVGRKADAQHIVPLCNEHHRMLHERGAVWFEENYAVDLEAEAAVVDRLWQSGQAFTGANTGYQ